MINFRNSLSQVPRCSHSKQKNLPRGLCAPLPMANRVENAWIFFLEKGETFVDPEYLKATPHDVKSLKGVLELFLTRLCGYPNSPKKIPLIPLKKLVVGAIDESQQFELETDTSDITLTAVVNKKDRPDAFFS